MAEEDKPKRPKNGYFRYKDAVFAEHRRKQPEKSMTELTKLIAEEYRNLPEARRGKYEKEYQDAMGIYRKEKESYDARLKQAGPPARKGEEKAERNRSKSQKPAEKKVPAKSPERRGRRKKQ